MAVDGDPGRTVALDAGKVWMAVSGVGKREDGGIERGEEGGQRRSMDNGSVRRMLMEIGGHQGRTGADSSRGRPAELGHGDGGVRQITAASRAVGGQQQRRGAKT